ncbi:MAG: C40 family peptidase [Candidatus Cryptobacteroides sp.]
MTTLGILLSAVICHQAAGQTSVEANGRTSVEADGRTCSEGTVAVQPDGNPGRYAVVNLSVNFLREAPDYTAELGTQALMGTVVEIKGEESYWRKVVTPEPYTAWCTAMGLVEMTPEEISEYNSAPKYICTAWHGTLYSSASEKSPKICDLVRGDILRQVFRAGRHKAVKRGEFVMAMLPDGVCGFVKADAVEDYSRWKGSRVPLGENVVREALKFVGVPYLWGGASPNGVDCSGLSLLAYRFCGVDLPRNASQQARLGTEIQVRDGEDIILDSLRAGDLLFFGSRREDGSARVTHVGIYISDGRFIHSSHLVRINSLLASEKDFYENSHRLLFARRIIK